MAVDTGSGGTPLAAPEDLYRLNVSSAHLMADSSLQELIVIPYLFYRSMQRVGIRFLGACI